MATAKRAKAASVDPEEVARFDKLAGVSNYFLGSDRTKWRTGIPTYAKVRSTGVYPGIDIVYYGDGRQLRDYVHVEDVVDALICLGASDASDGHIYNVASGTGSIFPLSRRRWNQVYTNLLESTD